MIKRILKRLVVIGLLLTVAVYGFFIAGLALFRFAMPWTTGVQVQRRLESLGSGKKYLKKYKPVGMERISRELQHAVVAAEDTRFREHGGIDWKEMEKLIEEDLDSGRLGRGGSTITQQLVKNLFFTTKRSVVRKGLEFTLVPMAEGILGKDRILELYLNVIEWGPGVYGAEAAAQHYYRIPAAKLNRDQAARLAAIIPNPIRRRPERMNEYSEIIQTRMRQMGW